MNCFIQKKSCHFVLIKDSQQNHITVIIMIKELHQKHRQSLFKRNMFLSLYRGISKL